MLLQQADNMASFLLQENDYFLLQEDGGKIILDESAFPYMIPKIINIKQKPASQRTNAQLESTGATYNEAGITYNEAGRTYGGIWEHSIVHIKPKVTTI